MTCLVLLGEVFQNGVLGGELQTTLGGLASVSAEVAVTAMAT
jgi:hypothetical protein